MHNPPLECIKAMIDLARQGKIMTLEFWAHASHVQAFLFDWLLERSRTPDTDPLFGNSPEMQQFADCCGELHGIMINDETMRLQSSVGSWVLMRLIETAINVVISKAANGELQDLLDALLKEIRERIDNR